MPGNWLDNLPDDLKKRASLSNNAHGELEIERIPKLTPKESWDHTINGLSISEPSKSLQITSDERLKVESTVDSERLPNKSTIGRCAPLHSLQSVDDTVQSRGRSNNSSGRNDELDSYITAFVQTSLSQAKQMVGEVMQAISEDGNDYREEETCTSNQATNRKSAESEATLHDAQLPSNLITNCVATILSVKQLSESRYPPAKVAGVLERASSMLHPSCSENLTIYNDIENCISVIKNQILALVPTTSGFAAV